MHDNLKTPTRTWKCRRCTMQIRYFYASDLPFKNFCKLSKKVFWLWLSIVWETEWRVFVLNKRKSLRVQWKREQILFIQIAKLKTFFTLRNSPFPLTQSIKVHRRALVLLPFHRCENSPRESCNCHHLIMQRDNIHARTHDTCVDQRRYMTSGWRNLF